MGVKDVGGGMIADDEDGRALLAFFGGAGTGVDACKGGAEGGAGGGLMGCCCEGGDGRGGD